MSSYCMSHVSFHGALFGMDGLPDLSFCRHPRSNPKPYSLYNVLSCGRRKKRDGLLDVVCRANETYNISFSTQREAVQMVIEQVLRFETSAEDLGVCRHS